MQNRPSQAHVNVRSKNYSHCKIALFAKLTCACMLLTLCVFLLACTPPGLTPTDSNSENSSAGQGKLPEIWVASQMQQIAPKSEYFFDTELLDSEDARTVCLNSACNETVSFQVIIDAKNVSEKAVKLAFSNFKSPGDSTSQLSEKAISIYRQHSVKIKNKPAWFLRQVKNASSLNEVYDPLEPISRDAKFEILPGNRLAFWIDIKIPKLAKGGNYQSSLTVSSKRGLLKTIPLRLTVFKFILPDTKPFVTAGGVSYRDIFREFITQNDKPYIPTRLELDTPKIRSGLKIYREMVKIAHAHKLSLLDRDLRPKIRRTSKGDLKLDWKSYDTIARDIISGELFDDKTPENAWLLPTCENWPVPENYGSHSTELYAKTLSQVAQLSAEHLTKLSKNLNYFAWPIRSLPVSRAPYARYRKLTGIIKSGRFDIPCMSNLPLNPPAALGWKFLKNPGANANIYAPPANLSQVAPIGLARSNSRIAGHWLLPNSPPYLPALAPGAPPEMIRALPWFAMKYNCTGLFIPAVFDRSKTKNFNAKLFYSGKQFGINKVLPSIRLKRFRQGIQDVCYLWILRQHNQKQFADFATNALAFYGLSDSWADNFQDSLPSGVCSNLRSWVEIKPILARRIVENFEGKTSAPDQAISDKIIWERFFNQACQVRVERISTSVSIGNTPASEFSDFTKPGPKNAMRVTISAELFNEYPVDIKNLRVRILGKPVNWQNKIEEYILPRMPAGARRTVKLAIEGLRIPQTPSGKFPIQLQISGDNLPAEVIPVEVCYLIPTRLRAPVLIDGIISDWPESVCKADRFSRLGTEIDPKSSQAINQTTVRIARDEKNLYFAFKCDHAPGTKLKANPTNFLRYDQLLAHDEDIIELIICPKNSTQNPADLYHFAVKANGTIVQERGVSTTPRLCKVSPIAAASRVAITRHKNFYIIEMSIPISTFDKATSPFWKINFARFDTSTQQPSNWANNRRYYYNPQKAGTILIVPSRN